MKHSSVKKLFFRCVVISALMILSACVYGDRTARLAPFYAPNGQMISDYLKDRFPAGTDEGLLIGEFKGLGYRYISPAHPNDEKKLVFPTSCNFHLTEGMGHDLQLFIVWHSDNAGKIIKVAEPHYVACKGNILF